VAVAGAGPAGIATAVALARLRPDMARAGRIACFDKARFPREKPCGGGLTGHAHHALTALGLTVRVPSVPCGAGRIVYGAETRTVALGRPVNVVRREDFDADLVAQARALGIVVNEGEGIVAHQVDAGARVVRLSTSAGRSLRARVLVAADGASSRIRKELTADDARSPARPLQLFKLELPAPRSFAAEMIYDFSPMRDGLRGYVWLFPVSGGRLNVGAMHTPSRKLGGAQIVRLLETTLARHGVSVPAARGWPAWPYAPGGRIAAPHILCVGDAAGIDALTGEGIAVGLEHGLLAAEAITGALDGGDFSFRHYGAVIRRATVGRELALDRHLARRIYARRGYSFWLSLVMFDRRVAELYAARVCGSTVLADRPATLYAALARHALAAPARLRRLSRAARALAATA
ncbi:MAG TPA: FAD-dependent monooxygenase, partial [Polyangia bacterium]|nr:FAD-dependent monooxygenase [Polyangia bacterium]